MTSKTFRQEAAMDEELVVVLITAGETAEAERVATALLEARLVGCVNLVPGVTSLFWWEGKIDRAQEVLLLAKTRPGLVPQLVEAVRAVHSYAVFEVVALPIVAGNPAYLSWLRDETTVPNTTAALSSRERPNDAGSDTV